MLFPIIDQLSFQAQIACFFSIKRPIMQATQQAFAASIIIYNLLLMDTYRIPLEYVTESIEKGFSRGTCSQIHGGFCNAFCIKYVLRVAGNTYKTYGAVYLLQLLFKIRKMSKSPLRLGGIFLFDYVKSTSLTAVQMMIMRRILCLLCRYHRNGQNNLIPANFLSAFYILVESPSRQAEIGLYQLTHTMNIIYNVLARRGYVKALPQGESLLFAVAIAAICFHFFTCQEAFRKTYMQSIFNQLVGQE